MMTRRKYSLGLIALSTAWLCFSVFNMIRNWGVQMTTPVEPILPVSLIGFGLYLMRVEEANEPLSWRGSATLIGIFAVPILAVLLVLLVLAWLKS